MNPKISSEQEYHNTSQTPLDIQFIQNISVKANQLDSKLKTLSAQLKLNNFGPNIKQMFESTKKMMEIISNNLDYLNSTEIFKEDFNKSVHVIDKAYNAYIRAADSITDAKKNSKIIYQFKINIDNFAQSIIIYSAIFEEIMNDISQSKEKNVVNEMEILTTRLGLESDLYNFSVNVEPINESPYFKSRFVEIYK